MIGNKRVYAVIPARGGSERLPRKNIATLWGRPLLYWAIRAAKQSKYVDRCFVSTEDAEIAARAEEFGAGVIQRPQELAGHEVFKQDVIVHAARQFDPAPELVVSLQANSPQLDPADLDGAIEKLEERKLNEVFSVDAELVQNACFRIMKYEYVFQQSISTHCGVYIADAMDVHTAADLETIEAQGQPGWIKE